MTPDPAHPDEGLVYILTNEAMPGYIKIGLTRADDVAPRLKQLDTTSVPLPFECVYAAKVPDCRKVERTLHFVFGEKRARLGREFFRVDPDVVRAILELVAVRKVEMTEEDQSLTPIEREAITEEKAERAQASDVRSTRSQPRNDADLQQGPGCHLPGCWTSHGHVPWKGNEPVGCRSDRYPGDGL